MQGVSARSEPLPHPRPIWVNVKTLSDNNHATNAPFLAVPASLHPLLHDELRKYPVIFCATFDKPFWDAAHTMEPLDTAPLHPVGVRQYGSLDTITEGYTNLFECLWRGKSGTASPTATEENADPANVSLTTDSSYASGTLSHSG